MSSIGSTHNLGLEGQNGNIGIHDLFETCALDLHRMETSDQLPATPLNLARQQ